MDERGPRILVVEDQAEVRQLVASMLHRRGLACRQVGSVALARAAIAEDRPEIIFLDVILPDGSGLSLVERTGIDGPLVVVITGSREVETAIEALRKGAVDYIAKPFAVGDLFARIDQVVAEWRARETLRGRMRTLEEAGGDGRRLEEARDAAVTGLAAALELKDRETDDHRRRVAENAARLGGALGISGDELAALRRGAYLHDVGNIGVPERILNREGRSEGEDLRVLEQHPSMGARVLAVVPFLAVAAGIVRCHHERWDGTGYPARLAGEAIPRGARVVALVDALDEATSDRPGHRAGPFADFAADAAREAGRRFDPRVVEAFLAAPPSTWLVQKPAAATAASTEEAAPWNA